MSVEENKAIQRRILIDIHGQGNLDLVDDLYNAADGCSLQTTIRLRK